MRVELPPVVAQLVKRKDTPRQVTTIRAANRQRIAFVNFILERL
jgi:hypothetical protein